MVACIAWISAAGLQGFCHRVYFCPKAETLIKVPFLPSNMPFEWTGLRRFLVTLSHAPSLPLKGSVRRRNHNSLRVCLCQSYPTRFLQCMHNRQMSSSDWSVFAELA